MLYFGSGEVLALACGTVIPVMTRHAEKHKIFFCVVARILINVSNLTLFNAGVTVEAITDAASPPGASQYESLNFIGNAFAAHFSSNLTVIRQKEDESEQNRSDRGFFILFFFYFPKVI